MHPSAVYWARGLWGPLLLSHPVLAFLIMKASNLEGKGGTRKERCLGIDPASPFSMTAYRLHNEVPGPHCGHRAPHNLGPPASLASPLSPAFTLLHASFFILESAPSSSTVETPFSLEAPAQTLSPRRSQVRPSGAQVSPISPPA